MFRSVDQWKNVFAHVYPPTKIKVCILALMRVHSRLLGVPDGIPLSSLGVKRFVKCATVSTTDLLFVCRRRVALEGGNVGTSIGSGCSRNSECSDIERRR